MPHRSKSSIQLDSLQSEGVAHRRTKRLRIDSDEDEDETLPQNKAYAAEDGLDGLVPSKRPRLSIRGSEDYNPGDGGFGSVSDDNGNAGEDGDGYDYYNSGKRGFVSSSSPLTSISSTSVTGGTSGRMSGTKRSKRAPSGANPMSSPVLNTPSVNEMNEGPYGATKKTKRKMQRSTFKGKRARQVESESEDYDRAGSEESMAQEEEGTETDGEDENISDGYDDYEEDERPSRRKNERGRISGNKGERMRSKAKDKDGDIAPILKKAKFEGIPAALGVSTSGQDSRRNSLHETTSGAPKAGTKRSRMKLSTEEGTLLDVVGDSVTPELPMTNITSPSVAGEGKEESATAVPPPPKKRKLPTIKKLKTTGSSVTGPSTPGPSASGNKPSALPPHSASVTGSAGASRLTGITDSKSARPKTNATSDLDLSNPSLYAELFKNPGGNTSRAGSNRRAKEEERRKELDKVREDYKIKLGREAKISFDLQGQAEKLARFEERLRQWHSSALYPNFLAAKWREEWEREKRRIHKQEWQQQDDSGGAKEEGEM